MADSNIGALPMAPSIADDSLFVMEQQGGAMKVSGLLVKNYAKQGVEMNVKDDVDKANAAADRAETAVKEVVDMTVDAHASDKAAVTKSTKNGVVNLDFGLPRGEPGKQGEPGKEGPPGPQGAPGNGLTILGHYDTRELLKASVMDPDIGAAYSVGIETPYDTYIYGSDNGGTPDWINHGPLANGGGTASGVTSFNKRSGDVLPETGDYTADMVGARGNHWVPTSSEISYDDKKTSIGVDTVQEAIESLFTSGSEAKNLISSAVTAKGVETSADDTWQQMADNIGQIETGGDFSDATATEFDIVGPKTAYTAKGKVEGVIPSLPAHAYTPGTQPQTISAGNYIAGTQTIEGDTNLTPVNIRNGVTIFGVKGSMESQFQATLTVTVDIGAIATATHSTGKELEALCTTGQVVFELPLEGQWAITARRGVAQYNSVVIQVSSQYSASLTAEIHIEYFSTITPLSAARSKLVAVSTKNYALFGGGDMTPYNRNDIYSSALDSYDKQLTLQSSNAISRARADLAAASIGDYALFGGGMAYYYVGANASRYVQGTVNAINSALTAENAEDLSVARHGLAAASIGDYALFGGGTASTQSSVTSSNSYLNSSAVDAYSKELTRTTPTSIALPRYDLAGTANENYAFFGGGATTYEASSNMLDIYSKTLTRETPRSLSINLNNGLYSYKTYAVSAGNYVIFASGVSSEYNVEAYDLFLTRTTPEPLTGTYRQAASLKSFAVFSGGDIYDMYLTHTTTKEISEMRSGLAAASIGDYALFGGGATSSDYSRTVDAYRYV